MGIEMGRVSGPLLSENLLRNGEDLAFETKLLYLDVNNGKIGINNDAPTRPLSVATAKTNLLVVDTQADIANFSILTNKIQNPLGIIYIRPNQASNPTTKVTGLTTSNLQITNQKIENLTADSNIYLSPNGSGAVNFTTTSVNISGWMHATGDITWDGNVILGNNNLDSVTFNADVTSNIIPDTNTYDLGSLSKYWRSLYSTNVNATNITTTTGITVNNIDLMLSPGHTIYVSVNGSDSSSGRHAHAPYLTLKNALANAVSGDEIVIFPGTYSEIFPLTVPQGVSIRGTSIRSVIIKPTTATKDKDAFLINGDTTISFFTIQDFFFNNTNKTGYAFRFANNFKSISRSPYIFNITVITKGSVTSGSDPLGYNQGDAGAGVLADGSVADPTGTIVPTMLFYATTFIIPNQDGITAKNGVRIEWLNSFTYYAKRGIYLTTGTGGFGNLGVKFGAEFRSINSANIYGLYGAVADGTSTKGYLVGHNFGFIGVGASSINDNSTVIQANEVVAINGGVLIYESMDHKGDFRIGDIFYVNQETGDTVFNAQSINFTATGNITFEGVNGITKVDAYRMQTGNLNIHGNNIDSLSGPVNFFAESGATRLSTNVFVTGLVNVTGDTNVKGNVFLGNDVLDTLSISPRLTQTIKPSATATYTLGSLSPTEKRWNTAFVKLINVDGILQLTNNTISTLTTNTDLRLIAAGTGKIQISTTDVQVTNSLTAVGTTTINGTTSLRNTQITGLVTLVGDINQTGSINLTGTLANSDNISLTGGTSYVQSYGVKILNAQISSVTSGTDLTLTANGTGGVVFDDNLKFTDNIISNRWTNATTDLQKSIVFTPTGTGNVVVSSTKYLTLPYSNESTKVLSALGEIRQNSTTTLYEGFVTNGLVSFTNLYDTDRNTYITPELTPGANDNTLRFGINGTVRATIDSSKLYGVAVQGGNIRFQDNTISNVAANTDLLILQNGTGSVNLNGLPFKPNKVPLATNQVLTFNNTGIGYYKIRGTNGVVIPWGTQLQRRLTPETGETRFNTTSGIAEVFTGTIWDSIDGASQFVSSAEANNIINLWSIVLG